MALRDYRKLCPKSGHALSNEEREKVAAGRRSSRRCEVCGQVVDVRPDPGTGRSLLYVMHLRDAAGREGRKDAR